MDYEKKYKEALEKARKRYEYAKKEDNPIWCNYEELFPELTESEYEEIRKDLIGGLMWQRDNLKSEGPHDNNLILPGFCLTVGEHLAYLEKHKESLHIPETCKENSDSFTNEDERIRKELIKTIRCISSDCQYAIFLSEQQKQRYLTWLEKHKEPEWNKKPCLTCQEYEKGHKQGYTEGCTAGYNKAMKEVEQKEQNPPTNCKHLHTYTEDLTREDIVKTILDVCVSKKQKEQKPAEWSEEDESVLEWLLWFFENLIWHKDYRLQREDVLLWLKSLRPSWKPNDEDEVRLINTTISFLDDFKKKGYENAVECIDWLKSKLNGNTCK